MCTDLSCMNLIFFKLTFLGKSDAIYLVSGSRASDLVKHLTVFLGKHIQKT